ASLQSTARPPVPEHRLHALHTRHPARGEPARGALVVGTRRVPRMRPACEISHSGVAGAGVSQAGIMDYLPIFLSLRRQPVVVVGGGAVALRKVSTLCEAGAQVTVVAPVLDLQLAAQAARGEVRHIAAPFIAAHLGEARVVIAA